MLGALVQSFDRCCISVWFYFFFFQAEDGIRDYKVTGVQTCALPISYLDPIIHEPFQTNIVSIYRFTIFWYTSLVLFKTEMAIFCKNQYNIYIYYIYIYIYIYIFTMAMHLHFLIPVCYHVISQLLKITWEQHQIHAGQRYWMEKFEEWQFPSP